MTEKAGLYIHIPFCRNKCPYCDFFSVKYDYDNARKYTLRLIEEIEKYKGVSFDTVYFGGGTPSILSSDLFEKIISAIRNNFNIDDESEITVECNPANNLEDIFKTYKNCGVNRISLGMQSAVKEERLALGRIADKEEGFSTSYASIYAGMVIICVDIMC